VTGGQTDRQYGVVHLAQLGVLKERGAREMAGNERTVLTTKVFSINKVLWCRNIHLI